MSDDDTESLSSSAAYLSDVTPSLPYTPFGAMIAKEIQTAVTSKHAQRITGTTPIGLPGKSSVKEVCTFIFFIMNFEPIIILLLLVGGRVFEFEHIIIIKD